MGSENGLVDGLVCQWEDFVWALGQSGCGKQGRDGEWCQQMNGKGRQGQGMAAANLGNPEASSLSVQLPAGSHRLNGGTLLNPRPAGTENGRTEQRKSGGVLIVGATANR